MTFKGVEGYNYISKGKSSHMHFFPEVLTSWVDTVFVPLNMQYQCFQDSTLLRNFLRFESL